MCKKFFWNAGVKRGIKPRFLFSTLISGTIGSMFFGRRFEVSLLMVAVHHDALTETQCRARSHLPV
jgi:hypothetical protein